MFLKFNPFTGTFDYTFTAAEGTITTAKKPLNVVGKEIELEPEGITSSLLGFFDAGVPYEIPAGKTFEVPVNRQGLWKESVSVQGTLNVQGHFDETFVVEPESIETGSIKNNAVTEAKAELPEMVKLTGSQTITGLKKFKGQQEFEQISLFGLKELSGLTNLTLEPGAEASGPGGSFVFGRGERLFLGSTTSALHPVTISGKVENGTQFEPEASGAAELAYAVTPEGGAAELASIKAAASPSTARHRVLLLVNVSATETLTLLHEGAGLAENRFFFASGKNVKLEPKQTILLWYAEGTAGAQFRWRDVGGCSVNLTGDGWAPVGVPTEIPAAKTYEVPANIQSLWKENVSVQGTLNIQGRWDEVGVTESSPWILPAPVSSTSNVLIPAETQTWFKLNTNVEGMINLQGQLVEVE